jgi:pyochelin biosynthetic protein PchC
MLDVVLPPLRDDLTLDAAYQPRDRGPLRIPMLALAGRDDPLIDISEVRGWADWTTAGFDLQVVPGGHFHLNDRREHVIRLIRQAVNSGVPQNGGARETTYASRE